MSNCLRTFRGATVVAGLLVALAAGTARAQHPLTPPAPSPAAPAVAPATTAELEQLVKTLQNDKDRQALIGQLQALIEAQRGVAQQQTAQTPATWLDEISQRIDAISGEIAAAAGLVTEAPRLVGRVKSLAGDAKTRNPWIAIGLKLSISIVIVVAAILIVHFARHLGRRGFAVRPELKARFPTLEKRANRYVPAITLLVSAFVYLFAAMALLQAWGINALGWIETNTGARVTGRATAIAAVIIAAIAAWELFSAAVERHLLELAQDGAAAGRVARLRTLLPLIRTTVLATIVTIAALIVLAELGINIVPLLAGASIVGVALAFGSQALVKDVITGLFILMEDTFSVGDVIDVGKGSGTVERISIRTIRLRDTAGNLQTIPFGEIATVRNLTRDYAFVVCDAGVLYREDPDRVMAVLRNVGATLCADPAWAPSILEPLDIWGVDRFTDTAIVVRSRLKVVPTRQWAVGREFNRRLKRAFDEHGIEMPSMNQTRYLEPAPASTTP